MEPQTQELSPGLKLLIKYIKNRINNDKNFMAAVIGPTGSGKSFATLALLELANPEMPKEELLKYVHFSPKQFLDNITSEDTESGDVFSYDESGVGQNNKNWQSLVNRVINYVLQTFRYKNLIVFFCLPSFSFLDSDTRKLVHAIFETKKIDKGRKVVLLKPRFTQIDPVTGKMYLKYLRVKNNNAMVPLKLVEVPKPSDELIALYLQKKKKFTGDLYTELSDKLLKHELKQRVKESSTSILTPRQMEILVKYKELGKQEYVAEQLNISQQTVSSALMGISKKIGVNSLKELSEIDISA